MTARVGLVVVSHSRALADAAVQLARQMATAEVRIEVAAGMPDGSFGTDAQAVQDAVRRADSGRGVLVLCDIGSSVLSADLALELLDDEARGRVTVSAAPLVEGLIAASVTASGGASLQQVEAEASSGLDAKAAELGSAGPAAPGPPPGGQQDTGNAPDASAVATVRDPHGLHARPAARLVSAAARLDARILLGRPGSGARVPASSLSAVMGLGIGRDEQLEITAFGAGARQAADALHALVETGLGDQAADGGSPPTGPAAPESGDGPVGAAPGLAVGPVTQLRPVRPVVPGREPGTPAQQQDRLDRAIDAARTALSDLSSSERRGTGRPDAGGGIFAAQAMMLDDPQILDAARSRIQDGTGAAAAWDGAVAAVAEQIASLTDTTQAGRAVDLRSVGDLVLRELVGEPDTASGAAGVVVADDLTPAQVAGLDRGEVDAVVLAAGSPTSHAAILARSFGIPMVIGAGAEVLDLPEGSTLIVDGDTGELTRDPDQQQRRRARQRIDRMRRQRAAATEAAHRPARTADGTRIEVLANLGSVPDAATGVAAGADGCGLLRTEFLYAGRKDPPTRGEQEEAYRSICAAMGDRPVVIRTLDAGGDKPLPFLPMPAEANPFLGERGIRLSLRHRGMLADQLAAICAVARDHPVRVMLPMVSAVAEVTAVRRLLDDVAAGAGVPAPPFGIMVEVPAVALNAAAFAPHVDFFSIGTNDLTQYALAAERGNPALTRLADGLDPGVLHLVAALGRAAANPGADASGTGSSRRREVPVAVCGELAADPVAVPILLGLGVRELSVSPPAVALTKQAVRGLSLEDARRLAARALTRGSAEEVRRLVAGSAPQASG